MAMLEEHQHKQPTHDFDGIVENRANNPPVYFTVLFYGLIVWGVAFSAFYLLSGWSSDAEFQARMQAYQAHYQGQEQAPPPAATPEPVVKPTEPPAAASKAPEPPAVAAVVPSTPTKIDAKVLFEGNCSGCHGAGGKGGFGPNLTAPADKFEYGKTRQALFMSIEEGRANGKMPSFKGQLKREEIYALADYILTLK